jgi:hypothetical protein
MSDLKGVREQRHQCMTMGHTYQMDQSERDSQWQEGTAKANPAKSSNEDDAHSEVTKLCTGDCDQQRS